MQGQGAVGLPGPQVAWLRKPLEEAVIRSLFSTEALSVNNIWRASKRSSLPAGVGRRARVAKELGRPHSGRT